MTKLRLPWSAPIDRNYLSLDQVSDFEPWLLKFLGLPYTVYLLLNYLAYLAHFFVGVIVAIFEVLVWELLLKA